jgi:integrase
MMSSRFGEGFRRPSDREDIDYRVRGQLGLSQGTHPKIVQEMLGHANISMTMDTYSHVLPDMQEKAVSAMDDVLS